MTETDMKYLVVTIMLLVVGVLTLSPFWIIVGLALVGIDIKDRKETEKLKKEMEQKK